MTAPGQHPARRMPRTLIAGVCLVVVCEALLALDAWARGWIVVPRAPLPEPVGIAQGLARWVAMNMTPLCWAGYLLALDGILAHSGTSPVRRRPVRFVMAALVSVPIWVFFDSINFRFVHAWEYHGLPERAWQRVGGYLLAFAAIAPAMFLAGEAFQRAGLSRLRGPRVSIGGWVIGGLIAFGVALSVAPFVLRDPIACLALWVSLVPLLDPINDLLGGPSLVGDLREGRYGRAVALMAGGLTCGLLWEFWNYWAVAKWTYSLPFLGPLERYRYFEMPVAGLAGFPPFALECWAAFQFVVTLAERIGLGAAEPLPDPRSVI